MVLETQTEYSRNKFLKILSNEIVFLQNRQNVCNNIFLFFRHFVRTTEVKLVLETIEAFRVSILSNTVRIVESVYSLARTEK